MEVQECDTILNQLISYQYYNTPWIKSQFDDKEITLSKFMDNEVLIHCLGFNITKKIVSKNYE